MDDTLERRPAEIESAFEETEAALSDPETLANPGRLAELGKRHADLCEVVSDIRQLRRLRDDLEEALLPWPTIRTWLICPGFADEIDG